MKKVCIIIMSFLLIFLCGCKNNKYIKFKDVKKVGNLKIGTYDGKKYIISWDYKKADNVDITDDLNVSAIFDKAFYAPSKTNNGNNTTVVENFSMSGTVEEIGDSFNYILIKNYYYNGTIEEFSRIEHTTYNLYKFCEKIYILDNSGNIEYKNKKYSLMEDITINSNSIIKPYSFSYIKQLKRVNIGSGVQEIGDKAFYECINLKNVKIGGNVAKIGAEAFVGCSNIEEFNIPKSIKYIGAYALAQIKCLKELKFPNGLTYVGRQSIPSINNLDFIEMPESLIEIADYLFSGDNENCGIVFLGEKVDFYRFTFSDIAKMKYIIFPKKQEVLDISYMLKTQIDYIVLPKTIKQLNISAISEENVNHICFLGTKEEWKSITFLKIGNNGSQLDVVAQPSTKVYYYSEERPTEQVENYWHYVDSIPTIWE